MGNVDAARQVAEQSEVFQIFRQMLGTSLVDQRALRRLSKQNEDQGGCSCHISPFKQFLPA